MPAAAAENFKVFSVPQILPTGLRLPPPPICPLRCFLCHNQEGKKGERGLNFVQAFFFVTGCHRSNCWGPCDNKFCLCRDYCGKKKYLCRDHRVKLFVPQHERRGALTETVSGGSRFTPESASGTPVRAGNFCAEPASKTPVWA